MNIATFEELQSAHQQWLERNFPDSDYNRAFKGIVEEVGELSHHLLKQEQGIRGDYEFHETEAKDAVGDIILYLAHLCTSRKWSLHVIVNDTTREVFNRDWIANSKTGNSLSALIRKDS